MIDSQGIDPHIAELEQRRKEALKKGDNVNYARLNLELGLGSSHIESPHSHEAGLADLARETAEERYFMEQGEQPSKDVAEDSSRKVLYGFWGDLVSGIERDVQTQGTSRVGVRVQGGKFVMGAGYTAKIIYQHGGRTYYDHFQEDKRVSTREVLDFAMSELAQNAGPLEPIKLNSNGDSEYVVVFGEQTAKSEINLRGNTDSSNSENASEVRERPDSYKLFAERAGKVVGTAARRELLQECWPQVYGRGRGTDLNKRPARTIEQIFRNRLCKSLGR